MTSYPPPAPQPPQPAQPQGGEPPLAYPYYGAPIGAAVRRFFQKYATFSGRASRSEFWWWTLIAVVINFALNILSAALGGNGLDSSRGMFATPGASVIAIIAFLWAIGTIVPWLALCWRRLHDTDRSGGWYFIGLIPLVGAIILIVFFASSPNPRGQRFDR